MTKYSKAKWWRLHLPYLFSKIRAKVRPEVLQSVSNDPALWKWLGLNDSELKPDELLTDDFYLPPGEVEFTEDAKKAIREQKRMTQYSELKPGDLQVDNWYFCSISTLGLYQRFTSQLSSVETFPTAWLLTFVNGIKVWLEEADTFQGTVLILPYQPQTTVYEPMSHRPLTCPKNLL